MSDQLAESGDSSDAVLYAAFRLPIAVAASRDVLGLRMRGQVGGASVDVLVPWRQDDELELDTDDHGFTVLASSGDPVPPNERRILADWSDAPQPSNDESQGAIEIRRLLLRVTGPAGDLPPPRIGVGPSIASRLSDELFKTMNGWYDVFRSWIEIVTLQDLDHIHPRWTAHFEGAGLATFEADGGRLGHGGIMRLDTHWPDPAGRGDVGKAIHEACEGRYPPLAHQLLRDARAAYYRDQLRKAILDAATATEISLTSIADKHKLVTPGQFMMLGQLLSAVKKAKLVPDDLHAELVKLVAAPRNKAIHEGRSPSKFDTAEACKAAQRAVWLAFPL